MKTDLFSAIRPAIVMTALFAILTGLLYPLARSASASLSSRIRPMAA